MENDEAAKVILDAVAIKGNSLVILYSCPACCVDPEGIESQIGRGLSDSILSALADGRGVATPCPNCGAHLILIADEGMRQQAHDILFAKKS